VPEDATLAGLPFAVPATLDAFRQQLSDGLQVARKLCKYTTISVRTAPAFDVLSASACRIWLLSHEGDPWQSASDAMNEIGMSLSDYYRTSTSLAQRKVFGLPVQYADKTLNDNTRLPSPLHLSIRKLEEEHKEQYIGVAVLFKTDIPIGRYRDRTDYTPIEDWIKKSFSGKSSCEVRL
jgi:hypothetical protein